MICLALTTIQLKWPAEANIENHGCPDSQVLLA